VWSPSAGGAIIGAWPSAGIMGMGGYMIMQEEMNLSGDFLGIHSLLWILWKIASDRPDVKYWNLNSTPRLLRT